jgi:hypothetical protein
MKDAEIKVFEAKVESLNDTCLNLKDQNNYLKDFVYGAGNILKKSLSNIGYLNLHYNEAPLLEKHSTGIKELKLNKNENLFSVITYYQKDNLVHKFIGDFIISIYKKQNPKEQSLWTTDSSRLNYLVRTAFKNKNIWKVDKAGVRVKENIIVPILMELSLELNKEIEKSAQDYINLKYFKIKELILLQQVVDEIEANKLENEINKYIAPHFNILRSDDDDKDVKQLEYNYEENSLIQYNYNKMQEIYLENVLE